MISVPIHSHSMDSKKIRGDYSANTDLEPIVYYGQLGRPIDSERPIQKNISQSVKWDETAIAHRRFLVRKILSYHLGIGVTELSIAYTAFGKPYIKNPIFNSKSFSVSYSGIWLGVAITDSRPIGLDIETSSFSTEYSLSQLVEVGFPESVVQEKKLRILLRTSRHFLKLWRNQEAFAKAIGTGLPKLHRLVDASKLDKSLIDSIYSLEDNKSGEWGFQDFILDSQTLGTVTYPKSLQRVTPIYLEIEKL